MIKVMIRGNWAPYVGTDYCYALGIYPSLEAAEVDARTMAEEMWEGPDDREDEDGELTDEEFYQDLDYWVEEYDPEIHDMLMAGGGSSFEEEFAKM